MAKYAFKALTALGSIIGGGALIQQSINRMSLINTYLDTSIGKIATQDLENLIQHPGFDDDIVNFKKIFVLEDILHNVKSFNSDEKIKDYLESTAFPTNLESSINRILKKTCFFSEMKNNANTTLNESVRTNQGNYKLICYSPGSISDASIAGPEAIKKIEDYCKQNNIDAVIHCTESQLNLFDYFQALIQSESYIRIVGDVNIGKLCKTVNEKGSMPKEVIFLSFSNGVITSSSMAERLSANENYRDKIKLVVMAGGSPAYKAVNNSLNNLTKKGIPITNYSYKNDPIALSNTNIVEIEPSKVLEEIKKFDYSEAPEDDIAIFRMNAIIGKLLWGLGTDHNANNYLTTKVFDSIFNKNTETHN